MCDSRSTPGPSSSRNNAELRVAWRRRAAGDLVDRAVVLAQPERAVVGDDGLGEVARLVLEHGEEADPFGEGRILGQLLRHPPPDPVADLAAPRREDLLDEIVTADGLDRLDQPGGEAAVVGRGRGPAHPA